MHRQKAMLVSASMLGGGFKAYSYGFKLLAAKPMSRSYSMASVTKESGNRDHCVQIDFRAVNIRNCVPTTCVSPPIDAQLYQCREYSAFKTL